MTARRMAAVAAGAFVLLVLARPPRPGGNGYLLDDSARRTPIERVKYVRDANMDSLRMLENSIRAMVVRDSASRTLAGIPATGRNLVITDARVPASVRQHMQAVYAESRARMTGSMMPLPVFVSLDSSGGDWEVGSALWVEPSQAGVPACALVVRVHVSSNTMADEGRLRRALFRALGPAFPQPHHFGLCAFESAYGPPSPAVRDWLRRREFRSVTSGLDPSLPPREPGVGDGFVVYSWGSTDDNGAQAMNMRSCAAGHLGFCLAAVAPVPPGVPGDATLQFSNWSRTSWWSWHGSPDLMNALAVNLGPKKFGDLWHANEPPPDAYRRLTGLSIDTLVRRNLMGGAAPIRTGAAPTLGEVLAILVFAAILAGLATLSHPRHRR